jgi:hypothetical protein
MRPMGVDDYPWIALWYMSCISVIYARFRSISINVFLIMRLREAPLSTRVLATIWC